MRGLGKQWSGESPNHRQILLADEPVFLPRREWSVHPQGPPLTTRVYFLLLGHFVPLLVVLKRLVGIDLDVTVLLPLDRP